MAEVAQAAKDVIFATVLEEEEVAKDVKRVADQVEEAEIEKLVPRVQEALGSDVDAHVDTPFSHSIRGTRLSSFSFQRFIQLHRIAPSPPLSTPGSSPRRPIPSNLLAVALKRPTLGKLTVLWSEDHAQIIRLSRR